MKRVLIIDNYDSFTHIIKQYVGELGYEPVVFLNDHISLNQIKRMEPSHIILSPGPGTVENEKDVGVMMDAIDQLYKKIPILGICLGYQAIVKYFGGKIISAPEVRHGKQSIIFHNRKGLFKGLKNPATVMRYHSLAVDPSFWLTSKEMKVSAYADDWVIMGVEHNEYPIFGVQFHPESLGTVGGKGLLRNFLNGSGF